MWSAGLVSATLILVTQWTSAQLVVQQNGLQQAAVVIKEAGASYPSQSISSEPLLSDTLVSTLSTSTQHTTLLHLLQRSKCIPLLNQIPNATLFAPTDEAWRQWSEEHRPPDEVSPYNGWLSSEGLEEWWQTEDAVLKVRIGRGGDLEAEKKKLDNQNWALRQHLLYHMLNYTLSPTALMDIVNASSVSLGDKMARERVSIETTLLFPMVSEPPLPPTPPPGSPWLPQGGEGMLGGQGQRLRLYRGKDGESGRVGVDWTGEGGNGFWDGSGWPIQDNDTNLWPMGKGGKGGKDKDGDGKGHNDEDQRKKVPGARWARNGVVVGIDGVLDPPPSIEEIIKSDPSLSYLSRILSSPPYSSPLPSDLASTPHLTIFAPSNDAFEGVFDDIEKRYLEGGYGSEGVSRVTAGSVVLGVGKKDQVGWSDSWAKNSSKVSSANGEMLEVIADIGSGSLVVNGSEATTVDIFASNGVIHILPSLLLPPEFTLLNSAEKVLLSVNATRFVSLLRDANISAEYIGQPGKEMDKAQAWTLLAPTDDVIDTFGRWGGGGPMLPSSIPIIWSDPAGRMISRDDAQVDQFGVITPAPGEPPFHDASPLAALLQYHILPGRLSPSDITDGMLVGTELRISTLKGERQRLRIDVSDRLERTNWDNLGEGEIRFGGASVLGKPVRSGKSIIYLISSLLAPPDDVLQTAVSDLQLSTFIAAVYAADLDKVVKRSPSLTWFIPRNRACNNLGLGMNYLLLPEGKDELRKVLRYHAVDGVIYSSDVEVGKTVHKTLHGGEIILSKAEGKNGSLSLSSPTKWQGYDSGESLPANGELRAAHVTRYDAITQTGVIHTIDSLEMPADVSLSIAKLIRGSRQNTMLDLMTRAGLDWVLQGREPTFGEISRAQLQGHVRLWDEDGVDAPDDEGKKRPDMNSLAMPSYTVLCPSDKAFSRLNITYYLNDRDALLDLLKLHIIPTQPSVPRTENSKDSASPPQDGLPLSLGDDLVYSTLYAANSKFGQVAFRATGDSGYIVGIRGARGRTGMGMDSARVGASGRATVKWRKNREGDRASVYDSSLRATDDDETGTVDNLDLWKGGLTLGGGVLMVDSVLIPYEPSWFSRWGWLLITLIGIAVVIMIIVASVGWWWFGKKKTEKYEPLEGEEDE